MPTQLEAESSSSSPDSSSMRKGGRVAYCTGLLNRSPSRKRGPRVRITSLPPFMEGADKVSNRIRTPGGLRLNVARVSITPTLLHYN